MVHLNEDQYIPHFQPIVDVINGKIMGYEILGRYIIPGQKEELSLGAKFHEQNTDFLTVMKIDRIIKEKAVKKFLDSGISTNLFVNTLPNSLLAGQRESVLGIEKHQIIHLVEKYNMDKKSIVIEITEDEFEEDIKNLINVTDELRDYGFRIAIDDLGVGFSNLERIGYLHPDIIKVDIRIMRESLNKNSFKQVLLSIAEMSQKLGSELLFEGIETEEELNLALSMGANLLQGFYFSRPMNNFQDKEKFKVNMTGIIEKFSGLRFIEILENVRKKQVMTQFLNEIFKKIDTTMAEAPEANNARIMESVVNVLPLLPGFVKSLIICDLFGYQISPSYSKNEENNWQKDFSDIGNNYAWKPYFFKHKAEGYHLNQKWGMTEPLYDMKSKIQYVIFTYSPAENAILIVKIEWDSNQKGLFLS